MFNNCDLTHVYKRLEELERETHRLSEQLEYLKDSVIGEFLLPPRDIWHSFRKSHIVDQTDTEIKLLVRGMFGGLSPVWIKKCNVVFYDTKQKDIEKLKAAVVKKNKIVQKNKE
jgi:hypothetical protein